MKVVSGRCVACSRGPPRRWSWPTATRCGLHTGAGMQRLKQVRDMLTTCLAVGCERIVRKQFRRGEGAPVGAEQQQLLRRQGVHRDAHADAKQSSAGGNLNPSAYALVTGRLVNVPAAAACCMGWHRVSRHVTLYIHVTEIRPPREVSSVTAHCPRICAGNSGEHRQPDKTNTR